MSCVPALFIVPMTVTSPSLTGRPVTMPAIGDVTVVLDREFWLPARAAPAERMRSSVAARLARAVSRADRVFWKSASERIFALKF